MSWGAGARPLLSSPHHRRNRLGKVWWRARRHFRLLHQFQKVRLHTAPAHVATSHVRRRGNFVDLVDVNDSVLSPSHVAIGAAHQVAHQILHITSHIARFGKLGRIRLHKGHADEVGDAANQVGFANAGRADENEVLLGVVGLFPAFHGQPDVMVMIAQCNAQNFLGLVLFDDEPVQIVLHLAWFSVEFEVLFLGARFSLFWRVRGFLPGKVGHGGAAGKMLAHELL
jgi:hypothetical protein